MPLESKSCRDVRLDVTPRTPRTEADSHLNRTHRSRSRPSCLPVTPEEQFLDSVGVQEIVQRQVAKHDEHRVRAVLAVLGSARPVPGRELLQPRDETRAIRNVAVQCLREVHAQQQIVGVLFTGQIWPDDRSGLPQHVLETIDKHAMYMREMARVLVGRPSPRRRPPLENRRWHFPHERYHDIRCPVKGIDDSLVCVHSQITEKLSRLAIGSDLAIQA